MRIRTVKPDFWRNEELARLDPETRLLAIGLLNMADDEGYFFANPTLIRADIFPFKEEYGSCTGALQELSRLGYIRLGISEDGRRLGHVVKFLQHQVISHPTASKIKPLWCDSSSAPVVLQYDSTLKGREGKGKEEEGTTSPPVPKRKPKAIASDDDTFWSEITKLYTWVDVAKERNKMQAWLLTNKGRGRQLTRGFITRWLNKCDRPVGQNTTKPSPVAGMVDRTAELLAQRSTP